MPAGELRLAHTLTPEIGQKAQPRQIIWIGLAVVLGLALAASLNSPSIQLKAGIVISGALAFIVLARLWYLAQHSIQWLAFALVISLTCGELFFLSSDSGGSGSSLRAAVTYGLTVAFCLPAVPTLKRAWQANGSAFKLCLVYFIWCAVTILYSLEPTYSVVRLARSLLLFSAVALISFRVKTRDDVVQVLRGLLMACVIVTLANVVAAIVLPHSLTWPPALLDNGQPDPYVLGEAPRFVGLFTQPNFVGRTMLLTVGLTLTYWEMATRKERLILAAVAVMALGMDVLADSRSAFVAVGTGCALYVLWRYGLKGLLLAAIVPTLGLAILVLAKAEATQYLSRGDVTTLTGRTDMWSFVIRQIAANPFMGYGYDVEGQIFQSPYFPLWWGPWDDGPHSSLHNGYLSHMIGVGIPATCFWLFVFLLPWVSVYRAREDKWRLKYALFFLIIPLLVINLAESELVDFGSVGSLIFFMLWGIAERQRLQEMQVSDEPHERSRVKVPALVAALRGANYA
jgi:O-antigen ligase